jgi:hypothetical protein
MMSFSKGRGVLVQYDGMVMYALLPLKMFEGVYLFRVTVWKLGLFP